MVELDDWLGSAGTLEKDKRAVRAWALIQRDPTTIARLTHEDGSVDTDVVVRIEPDSTASAADNEVGRGAVRSVTIFGVRNHPDEAVSDTPMEVGDRFTFGGVRYRIEDINRLPGAIQAKAMARA